MKTFRELINEDHPIDMIIHWLDYNDSYKKNERERLIRNYIEKEFKIYVKDMDDENDLDELIDELDYEDLVKMVKKLKIK